MRSGLLFRAVLIFAFHHGLDLIHIVNGIFRSPLLKGTTLSKIISDQTKSYLAVKNRMTMTVCLHFIQQLHQLFAFLYYLRPLPVRLNSGTNNPEFNLVGKGNRRI